VLLVSDGALHAAQCSTLVGLRYALKLGVKREAAPASAGTGGHASLEAYFRSNSKALAMHAFREDYKAWADENINFGEERLTYHNTSRVLSRWYDEHPPNAIPFAVISEDFVEVPFTVPLTASGDIVLIGRMDLVPEDKRVGSWHVVDHKFTRSISYWWQRKFRSDSQMSGYYYAAATQLDKTVATVIINAIEFPEPSKEPEAKCKYHKEYRDKEDCYPLHAGFAMIELDRSQYQLNSWRRTAILQAKKFGAILRMVQEPEHIHALPQEGIFTGHCSFCPFEDFCVKGRPTEVLDSYLVDQSQWAPDQIEMLEAAA
jgi:hypothetical protein